ncbi:MAG: hypothetical protein ACKOEZ_01005, partial [Spartobacteria bacterium]
LSARVDQLTADVALRAENLAVRERVSTLEAICTELNATEICYPGTTLRLVYRPIRSSVFPPGQDV